MKPLVSLLIAACLTGCAAAPTTVATRVDASVPAAAGTAKAKAPAQVKAETTLSTVSCPGPVSVVSGKVYDQDGKPIKEGAVVQVTSRSAEAPFSATVAVIGGAYVVNQAPLGADLEVKATSKTGFVRVRTLKLADAAGGCGENEALKAVLNFGGPVSAADPTSNVFYLSNK